MATPEEPSNQIKSCLFAPNKHFPRENIPACTFVSVCMCECCLCANSPHPLPHFSRLVFGRNTRGRLITEQIVSVLKSNFHDLFAYLRIINNRPRGPRDPGPGASCHRLMLDPGEGVSVAITPAVSRNN